MAESSLRVPPQNLEAERTLLGGILIDPEAITKVVEILSPEDFYKEGHRQVYRSAIELYNASQPIDLITITNHLKGAGVLDAVGGAAYMASLVDRLPTTANIASHAKIIHDKSVLRRLINGATGIIDDAFAGEGDVEYLVDQAEHVIFEVAQRRIRQSFFSIKDIVKDSFKTIEKLYERKESVTGVTTGYADFDKMTSGLQPADLIILAGRPSMGKTAFALNMAANSAILGHVPTAVFSLEMSKESLVQRLLCSEARVDAGKLRGGFLAESDWPKLTRAAGVLSEAPVYIDDTPALSVLEVRAKARRLQREKGLGLIVIDYLQLMRGVKMMDSREREISEISRSLKALAKEMRVPVVALSQLNRSVEARHDKRPQLSDLRESGAIEQDADVIAFVYRDEMYNKESDQKGMAEIIIGKQRNGPTGTVKLKFFKEFTRFEDLTFERPAQYGPRPGEMDAPPPDDF